MNDEKPPVKLGMERSSLRRIFGVALVFWTVVVLILVLVL